MYREHVNILIVTQNIFTPSECNAPQRPLSISALLKVNSADKGAVAPRLRTTGLSVFKLVSVYVT